jgi:hypothetical protein
MYCAMGNSNKHLTRIGTTKRNTTWILAIVECFADQPGIRLDTTKTDVLNCSHSDALSIVLCDLYDISTTGTN